ncbi:hypothetical protein O7614_23555 [Micromonospora sp. WMMD961]|nr:hypothetical protein [Micromonospora sp. WMMD961]MDG4782642.1 hypothetical protein [Micromonospora sp. WMMD961]
MIDLLSTAAGAGTDANALASAIVAAGLLVVPDPRTGRSVSRG